MSRLYHARYSESLYEQHTSYSPYDRLIEKVGFPKKRRGTKRWRDGDIESPGFLLLGMLITAIYFASKTSKGFSAY